MEQVTQELKDFKRSNLDARTFVVLDDCLHDDTWIRDKLMRFIFLNGRHWKVMLLISLQEPLSIPPLIRTNIDYIFIFKNNINKHILYENYASIFPSYESFCAVMDQMANDECLVIHCSCASQNWRDQVYWYKATDHTNFRLCKPEYWELSEQMTALGDRTEPESEPERTPESL